MTFDEHDPPVPLDRADVGDYVLLSFPRADPAVEGGKRIWYTSLQVVESRKRVVRLGTLWFYRKSGRCTRGDDGGRLLNPTEENLALTAKFRTWVKQKNRELDEAGARSDGVKLLRAAAAAECLRHQSLPVVIGLVGVDQLTEVFEAARTKGLL